jgi:hypothetical protein
MVIQVMSHIEVEEVEIEVEFEFDFDEPCKGSRGYYGEQMEPDYEGSMSFLSAHDTDGKEVCPQKDEIERAEFLAWESVSE